MAITVTFNQVKYQLHFSHVCLFRRARRRHRCHRIPSVVTFQLHISYMCLFRRARRRHRHHRIPFPLGEPVLSGARERCCRG